ncbi:hypothetical protein FA13DRAFT_1750476 [Coprinellus micaceus]|uniref:Secreted protein n=1 Tax=Coprinellus micaceus TaxID=71717 RepID=A0A4Y7R6M4_COPMI|nr:hypothetical protein FA13DRAFT_1750476 [Coprinellus micaceus]
MKTQIICSVLLFGLVSALPAPQFFCVSFSNLTVVSFSYRSSTQQPTHPSARRPSRPPHCNHWKRVLVGCWDNYPEREQLYLVLKNEHVHSYGQDMPGNRG